MARDGGCERVVGLGRGVQEADEICGDQLRPLVDELVVGVLAIRAGCPPDDRPRRGLDGRPGERDGLPVRLHVELLEVGGEAREVVGVGEHGVGLGAEEVAVPDSEEPEEHGQVLRERRGPEVDVHLVEPSQHLAEPFGSDRDHEREPDRRVVGVPPSDPVPEAEHVRGVDPELRDLGGVGRHGDEMASDRVVPHAELVEQPSPCGSRVRQRLERCEGLRRDDEERLCRVEPAHRLREVRAVDVRDEGEVQRPVGMSAQRLVCHRRTEIRAPDPDVDDVANATASRAGPAARADTLTERGHAVEHLVHASDDVVAVEEDLLTARRAQRNVEDRAVLGRVDPLAREHRLDPTAEVTCLGEGKEQLDRLGGDSVLGVVQVQVTGCCDEGLASVGVLLEECP